MKGKYPCPICETNDWTPVLDVDGPPYDECKKCGYKFTSKDVPKMNTEIYKNELEYAIKRKYNDETITEIKKRARGLLYRIDMDLYIVLNWIIDNIEAQISE